MENKIAIRLNAAKKSLLATCAAAAITAPLALGLLTAPPAVAPAIAQTLDAPHPGTEAALRRQIEGWERKQPVSGDLTPGMVTATNQQQAGIQKKIDGWGGLKSITFQRYDNGSDVYLVEFEGQLTTWTIAPLTPDGKIASLFFRESRATATAPAPAWSQQ